MRLIASKGHMAIVRRAQLDDTRTPMLVKLISGRTLAGGNATFFCCIEQRKLCQIPYISIYYDRKVFPFTIWSIICFIQRVLTNVWITSFLMSLL